MIDITSLDFDITDAIREEIEGMATTICKHLPTDQRVKVTLSKIAPDVFRVHMQVHYLGDEIISVHDSHNFHKALDLSKDHFVKQIDRRKSKFQKEAVMKKTKTIIWPIDPNQADAKGDESIRNVLSLLKQKIEFEVQPVSVVSADYFTTSEYFEPVDTGALRGHIAADCADYLEQFSEFNIKETLILENHYSSQTAAVRVFSQYVAEKNPDMVMIVSHGRKGLTRYLMGSFTESLLLQSAVPVLVLGPNHKKQTEMTRALIPVEIDDASQKFVGHFLQQTSLYFVESSVLFHKISMLDLEDIAWAPSLYGFVDYEVASIMEMARKTTRGFLSSLVDQAKADQKLMFEVSESLDSPGDVIIERVLDPNIHLVVMRSEAGPIAASVLGSVTRSVVRESSVPVMVYPFQYKAKLSEK